MRHARSGQARSGIVRPPRRRDRTMMTSADRSRPRPGKPPGRLPYVGQVLRLGPADIRYRAGPLVIRVQRIRLDLSEMYDGDWIWVEGEELAQGGAVLAWRQVLVRVDAIPG